MSKLLQVFPRLNYLLFLGLCFCSFLLHNYVNDRDFSTQQTASHSISESKVEPIHTDLDNHEDDLASPARINPHVQADLASLLRVSKLSLLSHSPDPLIPPPKTI